MSRKPQDRVPRAAWSPENCSEKHGGTAWEIKGEKRGGRKRKESKTGKERGRRKRRGREGRREGGREAERKGERERERTQSILKKAGQEALKVK